MNDKTSQGSELTWLIEVEKLPAGGLHEHIKANDAECRSIADFLSLVAIHELTADADITPWRKQGVKVAGLVRATIEQTCVITLDEFESVVEAPFERYYLRGNAPGHSGKVITIDPLAEDEPESIEGNTIRLDSVVIEALSLALDPYPKKPGATFDELHDPAASTQPGNNPFAVLKQLKGDD